MVKKTQQAANSWSDHYTQKAKREDYPARSVYKLQEIQQKYRILKKGHSVLDLGCAPGSWLKYAAGMIGPDGRLVGIDRTPVTIPLPPQARTIAGDITDPQTLAAVDGMFHVVLSDMAPSTTGQKSVDAARSIELCRIALSIAKDRLLPGGTFVCKIFQGEDFDTFVQEVKALFGKHHLFKPQSCRKASKEIYVIGIGRG
ncbi:RlmE family RNA methyltransferase [Desulfatirhabdium butyrativorans]|uniref:RlmE family RNA methyltransferase n=1 Tax=Desulfatirhabdium butyrativorans TaxID=340467 RepID=UPI000553C7C1|nr:RlmE family RNA methyltransferase [Desulfatirhabdium butyrativorans]